MVIKPFLLLGLAAEYRVNIGYNTLCAGFKGYSLGGSNLASL